MKVKSFSKLTSLNLYEWSYFRVKFPCVNISNCYYNNIGKKVAKPKKKKALVEVREVMRLKHYSIHPERSYSDWIRRYILFNEKKGSGGTFVQSEKIKIKKGLKLSLSPSQNYK
jgi:hypothetical protein